MKRKLTSRSADVLIVAGLLAAILIPYLAGVRIPAGPSMGKTLGRAYRISKDTDHLKINDIVVVEEPEETRLKHWYWFFRRWVLKDTVKRIVEIRKDGLILAGDNDERSTDSREWSKPIPLSKVRGVVIQRYPSVNDFRGWAMWYFPPRSQHWNDQKTLAVARPEYGRTHLMIFVKPGNPVFQDWVDPFPWDQQPFTWRGERLVYRAERHGPFAYKVYDLRTDKSWSFDLEREVLRKYSGQKVVTERSQRSSMILCSDVGEGGYRKFVFSPPIRAHRAILNSSSPGMVCCTIVGKKTHSVSFSANADVEFDTMWVRELWFFSPSVSGVPFYSAGFTLE